MRRLLTILLLTTITACSHTYTRRFSNVGKIVKVESLTTSFNEAPKSRVTTERASVVVLGNASLPLGGDAYIIITDHWYLSWEGQGSNEESYLITY